MRRLVFIIISLGLIFGGLVTEVSVQQTNDPAPQVRIDKRKLLVRPRNADGSIVETSFWEDPILWAQDKTQNYTRRVNSTLRDIRSDDKRSGAILTLIFLSFGYGVFHAAGPGHGKVVLTAWLFATRSELHRGLIIALLSSFFQAMSAIIFVTIPVLIFNVSVRDAPRFTVWLEVFSYAAIMLIGLYLFYKAVIAFKELRKRLQRRGLEIVRDQDRRVYQFKNRKTEKGQVTSGVYKPTGLNYEFAEFASLQQSQLIVLENRPIMCSQCGHNHVPDPAGLRGAWSWREAFVMAMAIGSRPCTGAIFILVLAFTLNIYWVGVMASFIMSFGTFLTVSTIAGIAVFGRKQAERLLVRDSTRLEKLAITLKATGGIVLMGFGLLFLLGTLSGAPSAG